MRIPASLLALIVVLRAYSLDINLTDGKSLVDAVATTDPSTTALCVQGNVDADELMCLREYLPSLTDVDLSQASLLPPTIPPYTFAGTKIERFVPPSTLTEIGEAAFAATPITTFSAPVALSVIGSHAFASCEALVSVLLCDKVAIIGDYAFSGCTSLSQFKASSALESIGECALQCSALQEIDLSMCQHLKFIATRAFTQSPRLQSATLPRHTVDVGTAAFSFCPQLTAISGIENLETLPSLFAAGSTNFTPDFENSACLTDIADHALYGVSVPTAISFPASLTHLGTHAMSEMKNLKYIDAKALMSVPEVDPEVWADTNQSAITLAVADGMEHDFLSSPQWCDFIIRTPSSGIEDVTTDTTDTISISTEGLAVTARSTASAIASLLVYLTDGRIAAEARGGDSDTLSLCVAHITAQPVIIVATDINGRRNILSTFIAKH